MPDYTTRVGNVEILALSDGSIRFTPDDFFPTIPAEAWDPLPRILHARRRDDNEPRLLPAALRRQDHTHRHGTWASTPATWIRWTRASCSRTWRRRASAATKWILSASPTCTSTMSAGISCTTMDGNGRQAHRRTARSSAAASRVATFANARYWVSQCRLARLHSRRAPQAPVHPRAGTAPARSGHP